VWYAVCGLSLCPRAGSHVLLSPCLSVCLTAHLSQEPHVQTSQNCVCCYLWPWIWQQCSEFCTSGFVDVMFSHNRACGVLRSLQPRDVSQREATQRGVELKHSFHLQHCAPLCVASRWLTFLTISLVIHKEVWLWRRTLRCMPGKVCYPGMPCC